MLHEPEKIEMPARALPNGRYIPIDGFVAIAQGIVWLLNGRCELQEAIGMYDVRLGEQRARASETA